MCDRVQDIGQVVVTEVGFVVMVPTEERCVTTASSLSRPRSQQLQTWSQCPRRANLCPRQVHKAGRGHSSFKRVHTAREGIVYEKEYKYVIICFKNYIERSADMIT